MHEEVARLETLVCLTDDANILIDVMTQIHDINTELTDYHVVVGSQLAGLVTFSKIIYNTLIFQALDLLKDNR